MIKLPKLTFSYTSPYSMSTLLQIFSNIPAELQPTIPFLVMKLIASQQWKAIMNVIASSVKDQENNQNRIMTSCVYSSYATMMCLLGKSNAKKVIERMTDSVQSKFEIPLPSGNKKEYLTKDVFAGDVLRRRLKDKRVDDSNWTKNLNKYLTPYVSKFYKHFHKKLRQAQAGKNLTDDKAALSIAENVINNLKYDFNAATLSALKSDILSNEQSVDFNKSFMYWIAITQPEENNLNDTLFHHTFLIEQFKLNDEVHYRIYQSWIKQGTLLEDFAKHHYDLMGGNSLTHQGLLTFLNKFENVYSSSKHSKTHTTPKECFGYSANLPSFVKFDGNMLSGLGVRYCVIPINPSECLNNFIEFAKSTPELKSKTFRLGS